MPTENAIKNVEPRTDWYDIYQKVIRDPEDNVRNKYRRSTECTINTAEPPAESNIACEETHNSDEKTKRLAVVVVRTQRVEQTGLGR